MSSDFPGIRKQARWIAKLYKALGLYSIPLLTLVTIVSISNVFTRGQLASDPRLQTAWAIFFAFAIEVNIVRLFFEAKLDHDTGAKVVGIGLSIVAGAALLIEGLQQSVGFSWNNVYIQFAIGIVVGLRVLLVVVLLAREGSKLASALSISEQQVSTPSEQPVDTLPDTSTNVVAFTDRPVGDKAKRIQKALKTNPDASAREIAKRLNVSPAYVSQVKNTGKMPAVTVAKIPATNGTH